MADINPSTGLRSSTPRRSSRGLSPEGLRLEVNAESGRSIKKAIIPIAGLGTRFLPLSKVLPKELWPLVDKPVIQYIVEEAKAAGIEEILFVVSADKKVVLDYFKPSPKVEKVLKDRKKIVLLDELKKLQDLTDGLSIHSVFQKQPLGDGHAVLQAEKFAGNEPCAVFWGDDVVDSEVPCILQLAKVFKTCQKPVFALHRVPKDKIFAYGVVEAEKIANRLFKIKRIVEKPSIDKAPSDLAIVGKYILTPEVFEYLEKAKPSEKGEIIMAEVFDEMLKDGKVIYGYEFEGEWVECGNKQAWIESNIYFALKHPEFGPKVKKFLREIK